ncbi:gliding motility lipoprotein GldB [Flavobacterium sp. '19STA2R22 D10 B1']|uniref:gliding motility lipoprotein GldB n=1 Tax=Flavobacterium aerium TaxID=3037261 RepID=UPI00278C0B8D|nr:gliding motility lipoprotein GldB [Flavobacterium sp. '19STA2R22 D10 B1']
MKNYLVLFAFILLLASCDKKAEVENEIEAIPVTVQIERFDKIFFESNEADLPKIKQQFPYFFPAGNEDTIWFNKMKDPLIRELYQEVQKKFSNIEPLKGELKSLFQHVQYYFPEEKTPKVVTLISEVDYQSKAFYTDSIVLISLDMYLGKDHKFYEFPDYQKLTFEPSQITSDLVADFSRGKIATPKDRSLLSQMIYVGRSLYLKDVLLPKVSDADKIGYTPEQIIWCDANQEEMWRYIIDEKILYDADPKLAMRFINPAPFSRFYLDIDNQSPGRVGTWIGWQIVRSYMKNNNVSLQELLQLDAKEIFEKSKYKPKK